jgi:hypothetical protein
MLLCSESHNDWTTTEVSPQSAMSFRRIAGLSGVVFVVLMVLNGILLGDQPLAGDSVDEVRTYLADDVNLHKTAFILGMVLLPFAVVFFAGLYTKLRASDIAHDEGWAIAAVLGAVLLGASAGVGDIALGALLFRGGSGLDDPTLRIVWDAQIIAYSSTGIALTAIAVAVPTLRHKLWPAWYPLLSLIAAAAGAIALVAVVSDTNGGSIFGLIGFIAFAIWVLATSGLLITERPTISPTD